MFGFPTAVRKRFRNIFLSSIIFEYKFDAIDIKDKKDIIRNSFSVYFPRIVDGKNVTYNFGGGTSVVNNMEPNAFMLISASGSSKLIIDNSRIQLSFKGNDYTTFDNIKEILNSISDFLTKIAVSDIKNISVKKLNVVNFQGNAETVLYEVFTDNVVVNISSFPQSNRIAQSIFSYTFKENENILHLNYGVPTYNYGESSESGTVILELNVIIQEPTKTSDILNNSEIANTAIYDAFDWILKDSFKEDVMQYAD